jgi:putative holliday junction resolvase
MGRIIALDIGQKRIGLAVTDPGRIIATPLNTIHIKDIWGVLTSYFTAHEVDLAVVGYPLNTNGTPSDAMRYVTSFVNRFRKLFPNIPVTYYDERFTSVMAQAAIRESGASRKVRQDKMLADKVSATIMLQSFMLFSDNQQDLSTQKL